MCALYDDDAPEKQETSSTPVHNGPARDVARAHVRLRRAQ